MFEIALAVGGGCVGAGKALLDLGGVWGVVGPLARPAVVGGEVDVGRALGCVEAGIIVGKSG